MIPVVFINCSSAPFVDLFMARIKTHESRTRRTLRAVTGRRVLFAETGTGSAPLVRCSGRIGEPVAVRSREEWEALRAWHHVPVGSKYDWQPETKVKYLYPITNVAAVRPFRVLDGIRHGRVWMEITRKGRYAI